MDDKSGITYNNEHATLENYHYKLGKTHQKAANITVTNVVLDIYDRPASLSKSANKKHTLQFTRLELVMFGVEVKDWLGFQSQFKNIRDDKDSETDDEFQYTI
jgi:hypothetical protein